MSLLSNDSSATLDGCMYCPLRLNAAMKKKLIKEKNTAQQQKMAVLAKLKAEEFILF